MGDYLETRKALQNEYNKIYSGRVTGDTLLTEDTWVDYAKQVGTGAGEAWSVETNLRLMNSIVVNYNKIIDAGGTPTAAQQREFNIAHPALTDYAANAPPPSDPTPLDRLTEKLGLPDPGSDLPVQQAAIAAASATSSGSLPTESLADLLDDPAVVQTARQCFLLYNMGAFSEFHQGLLVGTHSNPKPPFYGSPATGPKIKTPGYFSNAKTRIFLTSPDRINFANKLGLKKHGDKIVRMKTAEIAQLVPKLRIFKTYREVGKTDIVELSFPANSAQNYIGYTKQTSIDYLGASENKFVRGHDVGVTSFEWKFIGSDPFTATKEISATLKLVAQDFSNYIKVRKGAIVGGNVFSGLVDYRYLDLVLQPDCRDPQKRKQNYKNFSPECYEIRVEVGYGNPTTNFGTFTSEAQFVEAMNCHTDILILTPEKHQFNFKDDGSVELTINMRGRLESLMKDKSMNVLMPYGGNANAHILINASSALLAKEFVGIAINPPGTVTLQEAEEKLKELNNEKKKKKDVIEELTKEIEKVVVAYKQSFVSHVYDKLQTNKAIFYYKMSSAELYTFVNWQTTLGISAFPPVIGLSNVTAGGPGTVSTTGLDPKNTKTQKALQERVKEIKDGNLGAASGKNDINYFFLGDLLAVIFDNISGQDTFKSELVEYTAAQSMAWHAIQSAAISPSVAGAASATVGAVVLAATGGPAPAVSGQISPSIPPTIKNIFDNFRMILGNVDVRYKNNAGVIESVNLAHIPISVETYNQFMIDNVLSSERTNYPFFQFVNDIITSLVTNMLGTKCFGGLIDNSTRAHTLVINSTKDIEADASLFSTNPTYESLNLANIGSGNPLINNCGEPSSRKDLFEYFAIGTSTIDDENLNGDYKKDAVQGLYHIGFGLDRGLVKNMKFNKTNQEFLPEAQFASEGGLLLNQLSNAFDVSIEMVGNNLFKIGQLVYINAEPFNAGPSWADNGEGAKRTRSWANIMGLGGYHLITEIVHSISPSGGFNTTIKARWQSGGTREDWVL